MKSIPELAEETKVLENDLDQLEPGEMIEYEKLSKSIGRDVRKHAVGNLASARRRLRNNKRKRFECVRGKGIKRLNDSEIVAAADGGLRGIRRKTNKELKNLSCAEFSNLSEDDKNKHRTYTTQMGTIGLFTKQSSTKKIATKINEIQEALPVGKTLKLFGD